MTGTVEAPEEGMENEPTIWVIVVCSAVAVIAIIGGVVMLVKMMNTGKTDNFDDVEAEDKTKNKD